MTKIQQLLNKIRPSKRVLIVAGAVLGVFVILNVAVGLLYHGKTLPHTTINGHAFGNVSLSALPQKVADAGLLPSKLTFAYQSKSATYTTKELGVVVDEQKIGEAVTANRSWLPVANLFKNQAISAPLMIGSAKAFNKTFPAIQKTFQVPPVNAQIAQENGNFNLKTESNGSTVSQAAFKQALTTARYQDQSKIPLPVTAVKPAVTRTQLEKTYNDLQKQRSTSITLQYQGKSKKFTPQEVGAMYAPAGNALAPADNLIGAAIASAGSGFGIRVQNTPTATAAIKAALQAAKPLTFTLEAAPAQTAKKTVTYCVKLDGVDGANRASFENKLAAVYADGRGWSLGGDVVFQKVSSGCSMVVWLAAADQVPTFGAICDNIWSCTVHPNVIINYDRWVGASDAWNGGGGSLDDYRSMVINHETGHWFGFNHRYCSGAGQLAPVMQQQSIDLQGCKANSWPLPYELDALRSNLGL